MTNSIAVSNQQHHLSPDSLDNQHSTHTSDKQPYQSMPPAVTLILRMCRLGTADPQSSATQARPVTIWRISRC